MRRKSIQLDNPGKANAPAVPSIPAGRSWFLSALLISGFILSLTIWFGFGMDQSVCAYIAWVWDEYHLPPYAGVWDLSFPGIFIVNRLAGRLLGQTVVGFRIFDFLVQLSCVVMLFHIARRLSGSAAGFMAATLYSIYYYGLGVMGTAQRESFVFWMLLLALSGFFPLKNRPLLRALLAGLPAGFAFLLKPTFGLAWIILGVLLWTSGRKRGRTKISIELLVFAGACLLPAIAVIAYYWRLHYLNELYQACIRFNLQVYTKMSPASSNNARLVMSEINRQIIQSQPLLLISALAAIVAAPIVFAPGRDRPACWTAFFLMLAGFASFILQGKYFAYHLIPFFGFMTIFAGAAAAWPAVKIAAIVKRPAGRALSFLFCAAVLVVMALGVKPYLKEFAFKYPFRGLERAYLSELGRYDPHMSGNFYLAALYLKPLIKPGDQVEFFGPYPLVNFVLKARSPSRFPCVQALLLLPGENRENPCREKWIREYTGSVIAARPRFFLVTAYFPGQKNKLFKTSQPDLKLALQNEFQDLNQFLNQNYRLLATIHQVDVYEINRE